MQLSFLHPRAWLLAGALTLAGLTSLPGCKPAQPATTSIRYKDYRIAPGLRQDSALVRLLAPYADSINSSMNKVIGFATNTLAKKQPESNLGNLMADAMRVMASQKFGLPVDAAFVNYGGVRSALQKGEITIGKVYELMPFDNIVVLQKVKGAVLQQFLDEVASRGGWPISGVQMRIVNKKATEVKLGGQPLDVTKDYVIANSDYVANGGDDMDMLRPVAQMNKGYLFRDALIEYFRLLTSQGKPVDAPLENRTTYAN